MPGVSPLIQDLRYATRLLRRNPGTTAVVLLTLALGIGVNTAIFSFVNAILLAPLPYPHADRIVGIWERRPSGQPNSMTTQNYLDYAAQSTVFERIAATTGCCAYTMLSIGATPVPLDALRVSPPYFDILGASAALGRTFIAGDDQPGHDHVVVLSHRTWASRFGSDATLVGRDIRLDAEPYTVVGVMPENSPFDRTYVEAWLPLTFGPERMNRTSHWLVSLTGGALGLLKPGVTIERARSEMETIGARLSAEYPNSNKGWSAVVRPYAAIVVGKDLQDSLYLLFAAVGMVLLIGCVNLANIMLARGLAREREVAVRLALGAGRGRLIRQFLTESLLISLSGGALGILVGYGTMTFLKTSYAALPLSMATLPIMIPSEASIGLDGRVLLFAFGLSLFSGIGFGLAPALDTIRGTHVACIGSGRRTSTSISHRRMRGAFIVAEVALSLALLAGAGLLIRSFLKMREADTGIEATNVLTAELPVREHRFTSAEQFHAFMHQVIDNVRALPGVSDVAFTDGMPLQGAPSGTFVQIASRPVLDRVQRPVAELRLVSPSYFRALGLRLRRGRTLSELDAGTAPLVVVINETLARTFFGGDDPVGQRLLMDRPGFGSMYSGEASVFTIVGMIADEQLGPFDDARQHPAVYVSNEQDARGFAGIVVRASLEPARLERELREAVAGVDKDQPVTDVKTLDQLKAESMIPDRLRSALLGLFAAIALGLSAIGIYGVVSCSVVQRTHELGIRSALGASPANLLGEVFVGGMKLAAIGLAVGCVASVGMTRLLSAFLYGVGASDAVTLAGAVVVLAGVASMACYIPARKATRISPLDALRAE
jgi:putative ABC transport system permease protein